MKFNPVLTFNLFYHNAVALALSTKMSSIIKITDSNAIGLAVDSLKKGLVIALPTDTLYGIACDANNSQAINHIYNIKKRDHMKPLAICVGEIKDISKWAQINSIPYDLLGELLPGPVTLIFHRTKQLNNHLNPNINKVAVRIPNHKFMRDTLKHLNTPLALTSANESNEPSSLCIDEFSQLWSKLSLIFDGGIIHNPDKYGSTIVDLSEEKNYSIVRKGVECEKIIKLLNKHNIVEKNLVSS